MNIEKYIKQKGFDYEIKNRPSGENILMICPFCGGGDSEEISFAINTKTGLWNCLRENNCGKSGTFRQLQEKLGDIKTIQNNTIQNKNNKTYNIPHVLQIPLSDENLKYLTNERKFSLDIINKFKLFNGVKGEINIPYYKNGIMVNIKSRLRNQKKGGIWQWPGGEPTLFNIDNIINDEYLIITEGEIDCISYVQYGLYNVVSVNNGISNLHWIEHEWEFLSKFKIIYISVDMDPAGQKYIDEIARRLGIWRCKKIILPYKDTNECLKHGMTNAEIFECFQNSEDFNPPAIKTAGKFVKDVVEMYEHPEKYIGDSSGFTELDKVLRGFRGGEVTVWTGQNGSGKSTILNQFCLFQASQGRKCCIASLEMRPARYLKWAVEQALGKNDPTKDEIERTFAWIDDYFYTLDIQENILDTKLLELFEYVIRRYGIKHLIIDSLMKIIFKEGEKFVNQVDFLNKYIELCKKFDVHGHIVAHPRKKESDQSKPDKTDVKGFSELTDLVDNVIIIWRNIEDKSDLEENEKQIDGLLIIRKNREFGELASIPIIFDPNSRRFMCKNQHSFFK